MHIGQAVEHDNSLGGYGSSQTLYTDSTIRISSLVGINKSKTETNTDLNHGRLMG